MKLTGTLSKKSIDITKGEKTYTLVVDFEKVAAGILAKPDGEVALLKALEYGIQHTGLTAKLKGLSDEKLAASATSVKTAMKRGSQKAGDEELDFLG